MLTDLDLKQINELGINPATVDDQLSRFNTGYPYMRLSSAATVGNGIRRLSTEEEDAAIARWERYLADGGVVAKFQPASGAASRMFKALFEFADCDTDQPADGSPAAQVIERIAEMPFYAELDETCRNLYGEGIEALKAAGRGKDIIKALIKPEGMNYGALPKGLLSFHRYADGSVRTPLEEQLVEGTAIATGKDGVVRLHFTVSPQHRQLFLDQLAKVVPGLEKQFGVTYDVTLSDQKRSTDPIAANEDGTPFRDAEGKLVFRPGGHGALIENLNDLSGEVVFIKNIDNVTPDSGRTDTIRYKKVLGGVLIEARDQIAKYLDMLATGNYNIESLREMIHFMHDTLCIRDEQMKHMEDAELALYIRGKLDRPLRVCGMVRNEGEPGGGPFIAYNPDGSSSPQILESHQIDPDNAEYQAIARQATHFNPVDLACWIARFDGNGQYDLPAHVDHDAGFISSKSYQGRTLRALELPGLWNGAMSDWSTIFVEVPISTFTPVKTVNDLLRPAHQA